jgi:hypothetical protein
MLKRAVALIVFLIPLAVEAAELAPTVTWAADCVLLLRPALLQANQLDRESGRAGARISNLIEGRAAGIDSSAVNGSHVVSLGSGPDIYLPLYLYPGAKYFHLVDIMTGWGTGPEQIIEEIGARLKSISSEAVVEHQKLEYRGVLKWVVSWTDSVLGPQEKVVYLHKMDFREQTELESLAEFFGREGLGGIVITGIGARIEIRRFLLDRLNPGGSMITEMLYADQAGVLSNPGDVTVLDELRKDFEVTDSGAQRVNFKFTPHLIEIRKRD